MLGALDDPYTEYLPPDAYRQLVSSEQSSYAGIGAALAPTRHGLLVTATLPRLPAAGAGVREGDVITSIDGGAVAGLPYPEAVERLHGQAGTTVRLGILRNGAQPITLTVTRHSVRLPIVFDRELNAAGGHYEYVKLPGFVHGAADRIRQVATLASRRHRDGLILDLRGDAGGLLGEAVSVADVFQGRGVVVSTHGLHEPQHVYVADDRAVRHLPLVVLVNGATASAAEVVAGSLQRAGRAIVVGTRSYGKGTVQAVRPLAAGGALKLTVAVFSLAGGQPVNRRGIRPDVRARDISGTTNDEALAVALRVLANR